MFDKTRRIEELQAAQDRCEQEHGPYIELAKEIGQRVAAETMQLHESGRTVDQMLDTVVNDLTNEERRRLLLAEFHALPPIERASVLLNVFSDRLDVAEVLSGELAYYEQGNSLARDIDRLAVIGRETLSLAFHEVPVGARLDLTLYTMGDYEEARDIHDLHQRYDWQRFSRFVSQGDGVFQFLSDTLDDDDDTPKPELSAHELVRLGTQTSRKKQQTWTSVGHWGSVLHVDRGKGAKSLDIEDYEGDRIQLVLGNVEINDVPIFTEPDQSR